MHGAPFEQAALLQDLGDVPRDRFAFAVQVGREVERIGFRGGLRDRIDVLFVAVDDLVVHREVVIDVDGAFLRHEIAHVPVGRQHLEVLAEVLVDRLRLGGRLDDEQILGHFHSCARQEEAAGALPRSVRRNSMLASKCGDAFRRNAVQGSPFSVETHAPAGVSSWENVESVRFRRREGR